MHSYRIERHTLLRRSFIHLKGLGPRTERHLWSQGILDWEALFCEAPRIFKGKRLSFILHGLDESFNQWQAAHLYYFHRAFPAQDRWRLLVGASDDIAFFDIEASGGGMPPLAESTAVAFYFRGQLLQEYCHHAKMKLIDRMMQEASLFCTYNGAAYDVPFLAAEYGTPLNKAHIDLCPWLRRQGYKGGLKAIQKGFPHLPQRAAMDIDGFDAVRLWQMHQKGLEGALETLLTYNAEDALILEPLLVEAFNRELADYPHLELSKLTSRPQAELKTRVDPKIYALLRPTSRGEELRSAESAPVNTQRF